MSIVIEAVRQHALAAPADLAIELDEGSLTYGELWAEVEQCHASLCASGCHTIALAQGNGKPWVVFDLAAMMAGLTIIPIPGFFSPAQVKHVLNTANVDLLISEKDEQPFGDWRAHPPGKQPVFAFKRDIPGAPLNAKITFTSGSTGEPKGVVLTQKMIEATSQGIVDALAPLELQRHLSVLPLATLLENIAGLYAPLLNGSTIRLPSQERVGLTGASLDIEKFVATLNSENADSMILVPQLLTALTTLIEFGMVQANSFKMLAVGGGRVSEQLLTKASELGLPVFEGYGLSECCSVLTLNLPGASKKGSVGKPLSHAKMRVNKEGEIEVSSPVMVGYLHETPATSEWYPTGDLGYIDEDGFVYITGRKKNVFITAFGRNVNPEWIEAALTQQPAIAQAIAYGEGEEHNLALLWLRFDVSCSDLEQIINQVNAELPDYAQVHAYKVISGAIPEQLQTANGRLKRQQTLNCYSAFIEDHYSSNPIENRNKRMRDVVL